MTIMLYLLLSFLMAGSIHKEIDYYLQRHSIEDDGYDMVMKYAEVGDSMMSAYQPKDAFSPLASLSMKFQLRVGAGLTHDSQGRIFLIRWMNDTLMVGVRADANGVYAGEFNRCKIANGHGCYKMSDGTYYEGHWQDDMRHGFGIEISPTRLYAGTWRKNRFHGEHIRHTEDRIYGIDLSRYQHEQGRRRFGINWKSLRIKHLGRRIKESLKGDADYPVRFAYIKATQGISIRNRYFSSDYEAARKTGVAVGAYHFFSTAVNGRLQANYFLKEGIFRKGDLPPVIDIEPTNSQVKRMGGSDALIRQVRAWIEVVENRLNIKPVLYVNQKLLEEHLSKDKNLLSEYPIWIARYGEYKPGVRLAFWQLSSDGSVDGIRTAVDINIFNGYEPQWEEFLRENTLR